VTYIIFLFKSPILITIAVELLKPIKGIGTKLNFTWFYLHNMTTANATDFTFFLFKLTFK